MGTGRLDFNTDYEAVGASATDQILGASGAKGNILERLIVTVNTSLTSTVSIKDGNGSSIPIVAANSAIGVYALDIGARCVNTTTPGWSVTTGAGATVLAIGKFT